MTHPTMDELLAHLDGEMEAGGSQHVRSHVEQCASCAGSQWQLRQSSAGFAAALAVLDAAEPDHWSDVRAPRHEIITAQQRARDHAPLRRAAAILLLVAAGASAAVIGGLRLLPDADPAMPSLTIDAAPQSAVAAVSIPAVDGSVYVTLRGAAAGTRIVVARTESGDASVSVEGGTAPHVTLAGNRVTVDLQDAVALVRIELPNALLSAQVVAGGRAVVTLGNGVVTPARALTEGILIEGSDDPGR